MWSSALFPFRSLTLKIYQIQNLLTYIVRTFYTITYMYYILHQTDQNDQKNQKMPYNIISNTSK